MERAQHPGDVTQRGSAEAALGDGLEGLALEVEEDDVAAGEEHLTEMEVAMGADAPAAEARLAQGLEAVEQVHLARQQRRRGLAHLVGQLAEPPAQRAEGAGGGAAHGLVQRPLVEQRQVLRAERRIVGRHRQGTVELGGAHAEQVTHLEEGPRRPQGHLGEHLLGAVQGMGGAAGVGRHLVEGVAVEAAEGIDRVLPEVALVGDEALEDGHRGRLVRLGFVLEGAEQRRDVLEVTFVQEAETQVRLMPAPAPLPS